MQQNCTKRKWKWITFSPLSSNVKDCSDLRRRRRRQSAYYCTLTKMIFIKGEHLHSVCSSSSTILYIIFGFVLSFIRTTYGDCLPPPTYVNAYRWPSDDFSVGSSMVYFCESGYVMAGTADSVLLICSSDEEWIGPSIDCSKSKDLYLLIFLLILEII